MASNKITLSNNVNYVLLATLTEVQHVYRCSYI